MAATRLYVTCRHPGSVLDGPLQGTWVPGDSDRDNRGLRRFVFLLAPTATNGGIVTQINNGEVATAGNNLPIIACNEAGTAIWVTPPLTGGGTLSGTISVTLKVSIAAVSGAAGAYHLTAYISQGDSLVPRAMLVTNATDATPWTNTQTWRTAVFNIASEAYQTGDRIVIELGALSSQGTGPSNLFTLGYGTTNGAQVVQSDATDGATGAGAAWLEFSSALTFTAASAPANDACASAIAIASLPYTSPVVDSTASTGTPGSIMWWRLGRDRPICGSTPPSSWANCVHPAHQKGLGRHLWLAQAPHEFRHPRVGRDLAVGDLFRRGQRDHLPLPALEQPRHEWQSAQLNALNSGGATIFNLYANQAPVQATCSSTASTSSRTTTASRSSSRTIFSGTPRPGTLSTPRSALSPTSTAGPTQASGCMSGSLVPTLTSKSSIWRPSTTARAKSTTSSPRSTTRTMARTSGRSFSTGPGDSSSAGTATTTASSVGSRRQAPARSGGSMRPMGTISQERHGQTPSRSPWPRTSAGRASSNSRLTRPPSTTPRRGPSSSATTSIPRPRSRRLRRCSQCRRTGPSAPRRAAFGSCRTRPGSSRTPGCSSSLFHPRLYDLDADRRHPPGLPGGPERFGPRP